MISPPLRKYDAIYTFDKFIINRYKFLVGACSVTRSLFNVCLFVGRELGIFISMHNLTLKLHCPSFTGVKLLSRESFV